MSGGKFWHAAERRVGDAVEVLDRAHAELDVVARRRLLDADVGGRAQPELVRFVEDRLQLIAVDRDDLQAVGAAPLDVADPRADLRRRARSAPCSRPGRPGCAAR